MSTIEETLYPLIARRFKAPLQRIHSTTRFKKDLKVDPQEFLSLILDVEAAFRIDLDDEELTLAENVGTLAHLIENTLGARNHEERRDV